MSLLYNLFFLFCPFRVYSKCIIIGVLQLKWGEGNTNIDNIIIYYKIDMDSRLNPPNNLMANVTWSGYRRWVTMWWPTLRKRLEIDRRILIPSDFAGNSELPETDVKDFRRANVSDVRRRRRANQRARQQ